MKTYTVKTQKELDEAIQKAGPHDYIEIVGDGVLTAYDSAQVTASGSAQVTASGSAQVTAYGSAQVMAYGSAQVMASDSVQVTASDSVQVTASDSAQVRAYDSAQVRAYGSAQVRAYGSVQVRAYGSVQVRAYGSVQVTASDSVQVTASDSAQVRASDSAQVRAYDSVQVRASKYVAVTLQKTLWGKPKVTGGVLVEVPALKSVTDWIDYHGLTVKRGVVTLYKAVDDDYTTAYSKRTAIAYTPGSKPQAPDWDGGVAECGGGLHFVSKPADGLLFNERATRFVACPVRVADISFHPDGDTTKVKAPRVVGPIVEVDINGEPIAA